MDLTVQRPTLFESLRSEDEFLKAIAKHKGVC